MSNIHPREEVSACGVDEDAGKNGKEFWAVSYCGAECHSVKCEPGKAHVGLKKGYIYRGCLPVFSGLQPEARTHLCDWLRPG